MNKIKLLPCPFCGGEFDSFLNIVNDWNGFYIKCYCCGARSGVADDMQTCVDAWNERVTSSIDVERYKGVIRILEKDVAEAKKDAFKMFSDWLKSDVLALRDESDILKIIFGQFVSMIEKRKESFWRCF